MVNFVYLQPNLRMGSLSVPVILMPAVPGRRVPPDKEQLFQVRNAGNRVLRDGKRPAAAVFEDEGVDLLLGVLRAHHKVRQIAAVRGGGKLRRRRFKGPLLIPPGVKAVLPHHAAEGRQSVALP